MTFDSDYGDVDAFTKMLLDINEKGGPAFPAVLDNISFTGMSLRDWFAGQALTDLLNNNDYDAENVAKAAYIIADAMLKEREK